MIVCVCHRISHRDIERHAVACDSFDELQFSTGVATGCGRCGDCARAVFDDAREGSSCGAAAHGAGLHVLTLAQA
ncbi:MAG: (2Fe-2S)-binding protein [Methylibium sp.]|uniref:(2Fe-2S)-binding protein n=1 Tax=Methylibium sp. TaxID=2067992 RepID=UPI0017B97324|nr:(2Fe-2S)-binding protein [Methylibium sp.]MBA3596505.1 (2Fe-2S)-binding protein [Methylibium sp.]